MRATKSSVAVMWRSRSWELQFGRTRLSVGVQVLGCGLSRDWSTP